MCARKENGEVLIIFLLNLKNKDYKPHQIKKRMFLRVLRKQD